VIELVGTKKRKITATFESSANLASFVVRELRRYLEDHGAKNVEVEFE